MSTISRWCNGSIAVSKTVGWGSSPYRDAKIYAGIAQLVEHLLAKQDVASSSLVSRSMVM
jgi:hypothetical protein